MNIDKLAYQDLGELLETGEATYIFHHLTDADNKP
jgi:hypothetical protein